MERVDLLIKNGDVVFREGTRPANIAISDGKVAAILKPGFEIDATRVVDAAGKHVLPGLVDPEGHPGHSFPLDIDLETESPAAAAAGVTTWGIQDPSPRMGKKPFVQDTRPEDVVSFHDVMDIAVKTGEENCITDFYFTPQLETDQQAEEVGEYAEKYGVTSYKFYCHAKHPEIAAKLWYVYRSGLATGFDDGVVYKTLENVAKIGPPGIVSFHPENFEIVRVFSQRLMDAGRMDMDGGARRRLEDHQRFPIPGRDDAAVDARRGNQQGADHPATAHGDDVRGSRPDFRSLPAQGVPAGRLRRGRSPG